MTTPVEAPAAVEIEADAAGAPITLPRHPALGRSGLLIGIAVVAATVFNGVFHFALAHVLKPAEYSLLASALAAVTIATVPVLAVQAAVARDVASALAAGRSHEAGMVLRGTLRSLLRVAIVLLVAGALLGYPVARLVSIRQPLAAGAAAAVFVSGLVLPVAWGGLQGEERFGTLAGTQAGWAALRLGFGAVVGYLGGGASAVLLAIAAATVVWSFISFLPLRELFAAGHGSAGRRPLAGYVGAAGLALTLLASTTNIDVLVARLSFSAHAAGVYAASSIGARTILLAATAITTVLFTRIATLDDRSRERRHLLAGVGVAAALGLAAVLLLLVAGRLFLRVAFGSAYTGGVHWVVGLAVAMTLFGMANVYTYHFLALGRTRFVGLFAGVQALQVVLFALVHGRPASLVWVQIATGAVLLVTCETYYRRA